MWGYGLEIYRTCGLSGSGDVGLEGQWWRAVLLRMMFGDVELVGREVVENFKGEVVVGEDGADNLEDEGFDGKR